MTISPQPGVSPDEDPPTRWRWTSTPGWVTGAALGFVILCVILRTAVATRDPGSKDATQSIEQNFAAVRRTKMAYSMSRLHDSTLSTDPKSRFSPHHYAEDAVGAWKQITLSPSAHAADWRRLALTLSLFGRPGIPEALSHIPAARLADEARLARDRSLTSGTRRRLRAQAAEVPPAQEEALWKALYGGRPVTPDHVAFLKTVIGRLQLGWFEHAALAQLYRRAGRPGPAEQELGAALGSAAMLAGFASFEGVLLLLGVIGLLTGALLWFLNHTAPYKRPLDTVAGGSSAQGPLVPALVLPAPYAAGFAPPPPLPLPDAPLEFSYRARTIAFSVYMAVFMLIGIPLRLLRPMVESWSSGAVGRLNTVLQISIYVPVVFIAIWVLRRLAAAESPERRMPSWKQTFEALGATSRRPLADVGVGAACYVLLMPVFYAVTALSQRIFERFHTPINPVQFDSMLAQSNVDRMLLLLVTAVAAPIVEELMFRGVLYPALKGAWGKIGAALLSAAVFGIVHPTIPNGFLPIMLLGFAFALVFERRSSLLPNIVMHGIHNGLILITVFLLFAR